MDQFIISTTLHRFLIVYSFLSISNLIISKILVILSQASCWGKAASFPLVASEVILHLRNLRRLKRRRISFDGRC